MLGSSDPLAIETASRFADVDVFNLSFTPPAQIDRIHAAMSARCAASGRYWHRGRMPRTVLVFADPDPREAERMASEAFDIYIAAMDRTVATPPKEALMQRALIGDAERIKARLRDPDSGFDRDDRLMLWFEYAQADGAEIQRRMRYFGERVMPDFVDSDSIDRAPIDRDDVNHNLFALHSVEGASTGGGSAGVHTAASHDFATAPADSSAAMRVAGVSRA